MKRYFGSKTIVAVTALLLLIMGLMLAPPPAAATENWEQVWLRFSATAGETLAIGDVVAMGSDGLVYKADADDDAVKTACGIVGKGGDSGATVEIITHGILAGQTELSPGMRVYLYTTAGVMSGATNSDSPQCLGWVLDDPHETLGYSGRYLIQVPPK